MSLPTAAERAAQIQADLAAALLRPRRPRWTTAEKARHYADLEAALNGTEWQQPIPARPTRKANR
ncbi:hypothetical protein [Streptomyces racemochromogenes]|uniref:hypothetical protein n=1 Tax=Streptomyces racemochromogenes TaxID=67353 RepID=UPI0031ED1843